MNGKLTLNEDIADVAGTGAAYEAYKSSLRGKAAPVINGLTGDQRFFLAFAQEWASKSRPEALRQIVLDERSRTRTVQGANRPEPRCLVFGVQCPAGSVALPCAQGSREDLGLIFSAAEL